MIETLENGASLPFRTRQSQLDMFVPFTDTAVILCTLSVVFTALGMTPERRTCTTTLPGASPLLLMTRPVRMRMCLCSWYRSVQITLSSGTISAHALPFSIIFPHD
jgi:hypothetical protein